MASFRKRLVQRWLRATGPEVEAEAGGNGWPADGCGCALPQFAENAFNKSQKRYFARAEKALYEFMRSSRQGSPGREARGQGTDLSRRRPEEPLAWLPAIAGAFLLLLLPFLAFFPLVNSDLSANEADFVDRGERAGQQTLRQIWSPGAVLAGNPVAATLDHFQNRLPDGGVVWGHRLHLLLHGLNALLLWWVLREAGIRVAFATALLWAVHPAVLQPLYWPGYRSLLIGMTALLLPLGLVLGARGSWPWRREVAMVAAFCAPLVHPLGLLIPLVYGAFRIRYVLRSGARAFNEVLPFGLIAMVGGVLITQVPRPEAEEAGADAVVFQAERANSSMAYLSEQLKFALRRAAVPFDNKLFNRYLERSGDGAQAVPGEDLVPFVFLLAPLILVFGQWKHRWARNLATAWVLMACTLGFFLLHPGAGPGGEPAHEDAYLYAFLPVALAWGLGVGRLLVVKVESQGRVLHGLATFVVFMPLPAVSFFSASRVSTEVAAWTQVRESFPGSWAARLGYVRAHLASDSSRVTFDELQESLLSILRARPDLSSLRRDLLELYREAGRLDSADLEVRRLLLESPGDVDLLILLADLNRALNRELEVITAYERILNLEPNNRESLRRLGDIHQRNRRYDQSVQLFTRLYALDPADPETAGDLIRTLRLLGRVDEARQLYEDFSARVATPPEMRIELAFLDAPFNAALAKERLRTLVREEELSPVVKARIVRFVASMSEVSPADAEFMRDLAREAALAGDETDAQLQYTLGLGFSLVGDHVSAQRAFRFARERAVRDRNVLLREQIDRALRFAENAERVEGLWE